MVASDYVVEWEVLRNNPAYDTVSPEGQRRIFSFFEGKYEVFVFGLRKEREIKTTDDIYLANAWVMHSLWDCSMIQTVQAEILIPIFKQNLMKVIAT